MKNSANSFAQDYLNDLVMAMKYRHAKLQTAIEVLEMSDAEFHARHPEVNINSVVQSRKRGRPVGKKSSRAQTTQPTTAPAGSATGTAAPTTTANSRRSEAQKARWARIKAAMPAA